MKPNRAYPSPQQQKKQGPQQQHLRIVVDHGANLVHGKANPYNVV